MKFFAITTNRTFGVVSTLAVEWIEISRGFPIIMLSAVSTLAVEWIEIFRRPYRSQAAACLHPRGGVD